MSDGAYQPTWSEQLFLLRRQTELTGALHEAQVIQLKTWPLVLFPCKKASFTWSPEKRIVTFFIETTRQKTKSKKDRWKTRVDVLSTWVQNLLGPLWSIQLHLNEKKYATSPNYELAIREAEKLRGQGK